MVDASKTIGDEGGAMQGDLRDGLRSIARDADCTRRRGRRRGVDDALELWRGLMTGRWSLVDHFDHCGRLYVVAVRNPADVCHLRTLTERERQVVALAASGYANKLTAYTLGLATSTVAAHLQRAIRKLGLRDRTELVARLAPLVRFRDAG